MKQIYVIGLFFICFPSYSQLYIKSNANQDSYVYAEGKVLFIEKQVDITYQEESKTISGLYLRDEAQLLQGNSNTPNKGNGFLSVFQEGDATAYTYNYWSLPVTINSTVKRTDQIIFDPEDKLNSKKALLTSDHNGTSIPLNISNKWLYKFSGDDYSDWVYIGNHFEIEPGEGFTMKGVTGTNTAVSIYNVFNNPGNKQRYDFRGLPNNGYYHLNIAKEKSLLVGNPYPSALDLNLFLTDNKSITGIAYFWDSASVDSHYLKDYEGGYGTYSPVLGNNGYVPPIFKKYNGNGEEIGNTKNNGQYYARRFSPIGQGFLVIGLEHGIVNFKNEYRSFVKENLISSQFKAPINTEDNLSDISYIRLNIDFGSNYTRQLLLANNKDATIAIDRAMDAENISISESDAGWLIDEKNFVINVRPIQEKDLIPIIINLKETTPLSFEIVDTINFSSPIYLFDNFTKELHDLKNSEIFKIELGPGNYHDRFFITFYKEELIELKDIAPEIILDKIETIQNHDFKRLEIRLPETWTVSQIELFDDRGRKIKQLQANKNENYYEISTSTLSTGMYILKIKNINDHYFSKKIIISK